MAIQTTTFKGARYVVKFHDPIEWASTESYEAIEAVQHEAFTYISKQPVPIGVQIDNEEFWLLWADPNAQMEQLYQLVSQYVDTLEDLSGVVGDLSTELGQEIENRENAIAAEQAAREFDIKKSLNLVNFFRTSELVEQIPLDFTNTLSLQSAECDASGNLYIFCILRSNTSSGILYKFSSAWLDGTWEQLGSLPIATHGNSMCYDPVNNNMVIYNQYVIDCESLDIVRTNTFNATHTISSCVLNANYAIMNISNSEDYVLYKRQGDTLLAFGVIQTPSIGSRNFRQDACFYNNSSCQVFSGPDFFPVIRQVSIGGYHVADYIIDDIEDKEIEGCFVYAQNMYLVSSTGEIYSTILPSRSVPTNINPAIKKFVRCDNPISSDITLQLMPVVDNATYKVKVISPSYKNVPEIAVNNPWNMFFLGEKDIFYPSSSGSWAQNHVFVSGIPIKVIYYNTGSSGSYPNCSYLREISYTNAENTVRRVTFAYNEYDDVETVTQKLATFLATMKEDGIAMGDINFYGYGDNCGLNYDQTLLIIGA